MADRYLLESSNVDGYQLEDASGVLLIENPMPYPIGTCISQPLILPQRTELSTFYTNVLLTFLVPLTLFTFRAPVFTPMAVTKPAIVDTVQNLLLTTLSAPTQNPFFQLDWPTPAKTQVVKTDDVRNLLLTTYSLPTQPFAKLDWPNPPARIPITKVDDLKNVLLTTYSLPTKPFAQYDWIMLRSNRILVQPDISPNFQINNIVGPKPFNQLDWPTARLMATYRDISVIQNLLETTLGSSAPIVVKRQRNLLTMKVGF